MLNATLNQYGEDLPEATAGVGEFGSGVIADGTVADAPADAGAAVAQAADLTAALMTSDAELTMKISVVYHFFGFLWVLNFVQLVAWLVMSGAVCWWYFCGRTRRTRRGSRSCARSGAR